MTDEITPQEFGSLFEIHVRGVIAGMFMDRRINPTAEQWRMLDVTSTVTLRDIGEISGELGFRTSLVLERLGIMEHENE